MANAEALGGFGRWDWNLSGVGSTWSDKLFEIYGRDPALGVPPFDAWEETIHPDDRFIASHAEFEAWADGRKALRMEYFYREMRRKTGLVMDGNLPAEGQWNFDHDNRKAAPRDLLMPRPMRFDPDRITLDVLAFVGDRFEDHFGSLYPFWFAATRPEAISAMARSYWWA